MKSKRAVMMIMVAVLFGLAAVVMASRWMVGQSAIATNKVVVAARDVPLGSRLTPEMLKVVEWPRSSLPAGAIHDPALLQTRVLKTSLLTGEPILENRLAPTGSKGGLAAVIAPGKRAMTVRVNDVVGVAGFALPGNYVDVVVNTTLDSPGSTTRENSVSKTVLQRILVLAVAQQVDRDNTKPQVVNAVTMELTPEQAEKLDLARSVGTLSLVLRNQFDENDSAAPGVMKSQLFNEFAPAPAIAPKPAVTRVRYGQTSKPSARARPQATPVAERMQIMRGTNLSEE